MSACTKPHLGDPSSSLTSVTAKLLFPQGTTLYHLSCRTSMKPWDLYWLIRSEMFEVRGELGGRPMPYPRRENSTIISLSRLVFAEVCSFQRGRASWHSVSASQLKPGLLWSENAETRPFFVQNKVTQYKQNKQIQNYYGHTRNM